MKMSRADALGVIGVIAALAAVPTAHAQPPSATVTSLKVTVLSTMLAGNPGEGIGEWGFAALIEADGRRLLVDTGARAETVLRNAAELKVDLSEVTDLVITHNHSDHTGGLLALRREFSARNPRALSRAHVASGIFVSRKGPDGQEGNGLLPLKAQYEATGGTFVEHAGPFTLAPGVWFTGPVPRIHPERNFGGVGRVQTAAGAAEDIVAEDASVIVDTAQGLVVVSGCGHAGMINTIEHARKTVRPAPVHAAIGGFHLFNATDETLAWTSSKLREFGLRNLLGVHCTGIEAVFRIRQLAGLTRQSAAVGGVGASFSLNAGIDPRNLGR
jgi:7,8-dihydropterin-6-yl-methyl-4-(beta-D-ribofuranosyl)aminobenzene 5'-phosphate synthase